MVFLVPEVNLQTVNRMKTLLLSGFRSVTHEKVKTDDSGLSNCWEIYTTLKDTLAVGFLSNLFDVHFVKILQT